MHFIAARLAALSLLILGVFLAPAAGDALGATLASQAPAACPGSWEMIYSRVPNNYATGHALQAIDALSPTNIWAVGYQATDRDQPLIMHSDGTLWSDVPAPALPSGGMLFDIEALAPDNIWAVGIAFSAQGSSEGTTLILHWDGARWARVASPTLGDYMALTAISAAGPNEIWAVGSHMVLRWNGSAWAHIPHPQAERGGELYGITAIAANDVWIGGWHYPGNGSDAPWLMHWNGAAWTLTPVPGQPGGNSIVYDLDHSASNDVWAVGGAAWEPLLLHWNGGQWDRVASANVAAGSYNPLRDIDVRSANDAWAVGGSSQSPLGFHWDGQSWTAAAPPGRIFTGVSALPGGQAYAASYGSLGVARYGAVATIAAARVAAGEESGQAAVPVTFSQPVAGQTTFSYVITPGTAQQGADYPTASGSAAVAACQRSAVIPIPISDDADWERAETFTVRVTAADGAALSAQASVEVTISDPGDAPQRAALPVVSTVPAPVIAPTQRIAFASNRDGNHEIYTMDLAGGDQRRLTAHPARDNQPDWSPDGQRLVFVSERDGNPELYLINRDGSGLARLTATTEPEHSPAWSPDGQSIVFGATRSGRSLLYTIRADGTQRAALTQSIPNQPTRNPGDGEPDWSPDGSRIVFTSYRANPQYAQIMVINANRTGLGALTAINVGHLAPAWSPDGQSIAFAAGFLPGMHVGLMRADGSQRADFNRNFNTGVQPAWSPDGQSIMFNTGYPLEGEGIYRMAGNHLAPQPLSARGDFDPSWSSR